MQQFFVLSRSASLAPLWGGGGGPFRDATTTGWARGGLVLHAAVLSCHATLLDRERLIVNAFFYMICYGRLEFTV